MISNQLLFADGLGLKFASNSLLAAIGNQSFIYKSKSKINIPKESHYKKIHGFALSGEYELKRLLLIYSENVFSLFKYDITNKNTFKLLFEGETKDWINAALFLNNEKSFQFVLHMAHSALLRLQYDDKLNVEKGNCSVLELACSTDYSMTYYTCLCGNIYNELLVVSGNGFGEILIWQTDNAIHFDLNTSLKIYPLHLRLKAHNGVIFSIDLNIKANLLVSTSDDRSLKYWQLESSGCKWNELAMRPMFSCYGHRARVICAIIVEYSEQVFVISGGEDSYICIWSQFGDMLFKRRQQFGAPIWRLDFDPTTMILYSSGATGNIFTYNLETILKGKTTKLSRLPPIDTSAEFMNKIKYLTSSTIIGLSSKNRLFYMKLTTSPNIWKLVLDFPAYKCKVLAVRNRIVATCGYKRVTLLRYNGDTDQFEQLYDGSLLKGLIQSFHFLGNKQYIISDEFGNCLLLKGHTMNIEASMAISNCREPWITTALLVSPKCLLLSIRNGQAMLYIRDGPAHFQLKDTLKRLHGNMGCTFLQLLKNDGKYAYIYSGGHESNLKLLRLNFTDYRIIIMKHECVPLAWVEAQPSLDLLIGFNDDHLVAWSRQYDVLLQLYCGGGHRCWDYWINNKELHIMFVKQKHIFCHREILYKCPGRIALQNKWHTKTCNIIRLLKRKNDEQPYIVSAGEDNIIKISQFIGQSFYQCSELHSHISSIRHLAVHPLNSKNSESYWLIFSVGGRAQLCVNQLDINGPVVRELCSQTVRSITDRNNTSLDARLMSISALQHADTGEFSIYVGSADGNIFLFRWNIENPSELHLLRSVNINRCPLQMHSFNNINLLLITSTSGELYGFDHTLCFKRFQLQLHDAGVNTFDTLVDDNLLYVLSGGDDENIKHTTIKLEDMSVQQTTKFSNLHNAQVNALTVRSYKVDGQNNKLCAYTCSMDKQIYLVDLRTLQFTRIGYTCISDIKGMVLDDNDHLYIYGCGLQVMALKNDFVHI